MSEWVSEIPSRGSQLVDSSCTSRGPALLRNFLVGSYLPIDPRRVKTQSQLREKQYCLEESLPLALPFFIHFLFFPFLFLTFNYSNYLLFPLQLFIHVVLITFLVVLNFSQKEMSWDCALRHFTTPHQRLTTAPAEHVASSSASAQSAKQPSHIFFHSFQRINPHENQ